MSKNPQERRPTTSPPSAASAAALHRSGAVARMLRMPVATLRVWERRYQLTQPETSPSGQRLYSAAEIQRLALIKRLSDLGHAIGSLARLDMDQLQSVAATHAQALSETKESRKRTKASPTPTPLDSPAGQSAAQPAWRLAVIDESGGTLMRRLADPKFLRRLSRPLQLLGPFRSPAEASASLSEQPVDLLLQQVSRLHEGEQAHPAPAWQQQAVLYRFASEASCERLADAGVKLLREPQSDSALGQWLQLLLQAAPTAQSAAASTTASGDAAQTPIAARRWDDAALADFASLSSTVACECPRHVAELLIQLSHFEAYSAECAHRSPADAQLHHDLRRVAAQSRASFETALELIALHEGLLLPPA